ncbi:MAG: hypothetical protein ACLSG5_00260 [Oscillospiraceae bacterium]
MFSQDDSSIFAAVCGADNGELEYRLLRFDLDNAEGSVWETYLGNHMVFSLEQSGKELFAVTAGGAYILDADTGGISAQTEFIKNVSQYPAGATCGDVQRQRWRKSPDGLQRYAGSDRRCRTSERHQGAR